MFKALHEKNNTFAALHPRVVMYGIGIGATLGIGLTVSSVMNPHEGFASSYRGCCYLSPSNKQASPISLYINR